MYHSITVSLCMKAVRTLQRGYAHSMTRRLLSHFGGVNICWKNSLVHKMLTKEKPLFAGSFFCRLFCVFFAAVAWICRKLHQWLISPLRNSLLAGGLEEMMTDFNGLCAFLSLLLLYTGIFTFVLSFFFHHGMKIALLFFFAGLLGSALQGRYVQILQGSKILDFFLDFFRLDRKEEDQWW